jgi:hypothetical protein
VPRCSTRLIQEGVNVRERFDLGLRDGVEALPAPVIVADAPRAVGLPREHHRGRVSRGSVLNPTTVEQVADLAPKLRKLAFLQPFEGPGPRHWAITSL